MVAKFDDPNLVSSAGLVPGMALAASARLRELADERLSVPTDKGANAGLKVSSLVAGMVAGADSIDDMALLRHGGMGRVFSHAYAPSTLGSFLRSFTFGHVRQLDAVAARFLTGLADWTPLVGRVADGEFVLVDVDDTIIEVHGYAKQGAGFGYSGVRGLNALLATVTTTSTAPVIVAQRLRKGSCGSPRGAKRLVTDVLKTVRGLAGLSNGRPMACRLGVLRPRSGAGRDPRRCRGLGHRPPRQTGQGRDRRHQRTTRMRGPRSSTPTRSTTRKPGSGSLAPRSPRCRSPRSRPEPRTSECRAGSWSAGSPTSTPARTRHSGQDTLFDVWRFHAFFTTVPAEAMDTVTADKVHRGHAIIEQVNADLKNSALAHLPSGVFTANAAWLVLAVMAFNLTRAATTLAGGDLAKATTGTIRRKLINVAARIASSARRITLHLPVGWPWQPHWTALFDQTCRPPTTATP
jgi:Transposase DDE domain group 1